MSDPVIKCRFGHQGNRMTYRHKASGDIAHWCVDCGGWLEPHFSKAGEWIRLRTHAGQPR